MPQATRRWISEKVKSLHESDVLPFHDILDAEMVNAALAVGRGHVQGANLHPVCDPLHVPLPGARPRSLVPCGGRAVDRLAGGQRPQALLAGDQQLLRRTPAAPPGGHRRLVHQTAQQDRSRRQRPVALEGTQGLAGRRHHRLDARHRGEPASASPRRTPRASAWDSRWSGMVAIISLATGVVRDLALGPYKGKETGETALFRTLLEGLEPGEIVLGDRYFASYFMLAELMQRGVDGLFRMHQRRKFDFRRGRRLGVEDHVVTWTKPERPEWMDEETYAQIPDELKIRELRFKVQQPGFRVNELVLVTTMLDAEEYTKEELADLFLQRWNIELDLRSIKDVLQMDVLRCKTPEMVEKEIWMHLLAYNLIRGVMAKAAEAHDKQPRQLSFKGTLQTMTAFQDALRWATPPDREHLVQAMLKAIAHHRVGDRFGRVEPRANKRRPKAQQVPMEPRKQARKRLLQAA